DKAIINRMGFNNKGLEHYRAALKHWQTTSPEGFQGILGANVGKNKNSPNDASDYLAMLDGVYGLSDYITINVSSPNTPGLREMQLEGALNDLLGAINIKKRQL